MRRRDPFRPLSEQQSPAAVSGRSVENTKHKSTSSLFSSPSLFMVETEDGVRGEEIRRSFPQVMCEDIRRNILQKTQNQKENRETKNDGSSKSDKNNSCEKCRLSLTRAANAENRMKSMRTAMKNMEKEKLGAQKEFQEVMEKTVAEETGRVREEVEDSFRKEISLMRELHAREVEGMNQSACSCIIA